MLKLGLHATRQNDAATGDSLKFLLTDLSPVQRTCGEIQPEHGHTVDFARCRLLASQVDAAIASAVRSDGFGDVTHLRALGEELYRLLVPKTLDTELARVVRTNAERDGGLAFVVLSLPRNLLWLPWEIVHDGSEFWCLKYGLGRTINNVGSAPTKLPNDVMSVSIVTDPNGDFRKLYSPERDEAERVQRVIIRSGNSVRTTGSILRGRKDSPVTRKMLRDVFCDCEILHFSGHGSHREGKPDESGWECADGIFSAAYIASELTAAASAPLLVFSSACVVGRIDNWEDNQGSTASFAAALLKRGVQFVVGAAWEIEFNRSSEFAAHFYGALLDDGHDAPIGAAVRISREAISRDSNCRDLLWASYVLYGDPSASLIASQRPGETRVLAGTASRKETEPRALPIQPQAVEHFAGRAFLFEKVDAFLAQERKRFLLIKGSPGIGKSAFLSEYVSRKEKPFVYLPVEDALREPENFFDALRDQALLRYGVSTGARATPREILAALGTHRHAANDLAVIIVDGLDQSLADLQGETVVDRLAFDPPDGVLVIAATRPIADVADPVEFGLASSQTVDLDTDEFFALHAEDAKEFLRKHPTTKGLNDEQIEELVFKTRGNFQYLVAVTRYIEEFGAEGLAFPDLPHDLSGWYRLHYRRLKKKLDATHDRSRFDELHGFLMVAEGSVPWELLSRWMERLARSRGMMVTTSELEEYVSRAGAFLQFGEEGGKKTCRIYHESFREYLASDSLGTLPLAAELHRTIVDHYREHHADDWSMVTDAYGLRYLPHHYAEWIDREENNAARIRGVEELRDLLNLPFSVARFRERQWSSEMVRRFAQDFSRFGATTRQNVFGDRFAGSTDIVLMRFANTAKEFTSEHTALAAECLIRESLIPDQQKWVEKTLASLSQAVLPVGPRYVVLLAVSRIQLDRTRLLDLLMDEVIYDDNPEVRKRARDSTSPF